MEYQVPQFIEVEDKLIGPLTLKQFIYVAGGAGICAIFFFLLPTFVALLLSIPFGGFALALAFYKMNGKPFIEVVEAGFNYFVRPKLFLWKHQEPKAPEPTKEPSAPTHLQPGDAASDGMKHASPRLTRGKLSELAWSLDVKKPGENGDELES